MTSSGGIGPYAWSIVSGSLPPGLALNVSGGVIAGTPTAPGPYAFTAQVRDSAARIATNPFAINIALGAPQCRLYVSPTGRDADDGSADRPWLTIQHAANSVQPGNTVCVRPGAYNEAFQPDLYTGVASYISGTPTAPIQFVCTVKWACRVSTTAPTFTAYGATWDNRGAYVTIQDFDVSGTNVAIGIFAGGPNSQIIGNRVHDLPVPCDNLGAGGIIPGDVPGNENVDVIGNLIFHIGAPTTVNITSISRDGVTGLVTVTTSASHRITYATAEVIVAGVTDSTGLSFNGRFFTDDNGGDWSATTFRYTQARGYGGTGSGGTSTNTSCNHISGIFQQIPGSKLQNNIIHNNLGDGIGASHRSAHVTISNNLIFRNGFAGMDIAGTNPSSLAEDFTVTNNIVINNGNAGIFEEDLLDDIPSPYYIGPGNVYFNNLVRNNTSLRRGLRGIVVCNGPENNCGNLVSTVSGTLTSDPLFVNYQDDGSGDYHLAAGSPCIGSGVPDGAPPFDFDGMPRPQGGTYSIGPYERRP
jgi:hypothetical protein